jgi:type I restriction enzyme S subunit
MSADYEQYPFPKGEHPSGWVETTVGEVLVEIRSGYSSGKHNQVGQGISHLRPMNVSPDGEIFMEDVRYVSPSVGSLRLTKNDVLFTNTSSTVWVGKTALVEKPSDWGFSNHMTRLRVAEGMSPEFVARQLHYLCLCNYFAFHCKKHINQSSIAGTQLAERIPFLLPPTKEQKRIAAKLRRLLARKRKLRQQLEALHELVQQYRAAVLDAAFTGRLVPSEAELSRKEHRDFESASVLLERILVERRVRWEADQFAKMRVVGKEPNNDKWKKQYKEPDPPDQEDGKVQPRGWTSASVAQCGFVQLGRQRSPNNRSKNYPRPYIRAANVTESGIDVTDILQMDFPPDEFERFQLHVGDILLSEASGSPEQVGKPAIWAGEIEDCCFQNTVIRLKPVILGSDFLLLICKHFYTNGVFARVSGGVGINHLSVGKFSRMVIPLPPLIEQDRIVTEVKRRLAALADVEKQIKGALKETIFLRLSFFHRALSGKLVEQNHSDEPATKLLSRIRKLKGQLAKQPKIREVASPQIKSEKLPMFTLEDITPTHLADILRKHDKPLDAKTLWKESQLTVDDFYAQLKKEFGRSLKETAKDRMLEVKS